MRVTVPVALVLGLLAAPVLACSFCGGNVSTRNTLREEFAQAKAVVGGTLKNPNAAAGTTDFQIADRLKSHAAVENRKQIVIPKYYPVIGDTPPDYLLFLDVRNDAPDVTFGLPQTAAVKKYLAEVSKLDPKDVTKRLAFYFQHLDSTDTTVNEDAFLEFAKASDADVILAKAALDPKRIQKWLVDPKTPTERVGVYAMLLGLCGERDHAATFAAMLKAPHSEAVKANLGGLLAGYAMLDAKGGWASITGALDGKRTFEDKFSTLSGVRYLQATRAKEHRDEILKLYRWLLTDADFADLVIEDLRRWGWWDLTADVLDTFAKPIAQAQAMKRAVVRYALTCPEDAAKRFVADVRKADPKLVERVEESLSLLK
jgi:hypothetical protein